MSIEKMKELSQVQKYYKLLNLKHFNLGFDEIKGTVYINWLHKLDTCELHDRIYTDRIETGVELFNSYTMFGGWNIQQIKLLLSHIEEDFYNKDYQEELKRLIEDGEL